MSDLCIAIESVFLACWKKCFIYTCVQLNLEYTCTLSQEELPGNLKKHLILLNVGIHNSKTSKRNKCRYDKYMCIKSLYLNINEWLKLLDTLRKKFKE